MKKDIYEKMEILANSAKYDVSCSSSGVETSFKKGELGATHNSGICHTFTADGRCVSLLKVLLTNFCIYDCAYCINRVSNDIPRASFSPRELADITINFYKRNYIEGLFLSSGIIRSPDYTTELLIQVARLLREREHFNGYIHMKGIPGTDQALLNELGRYVDRVSVNIELPSEKSLRLLAPQKTRNAILAPMKFFKESIEVHREEKKHFKKAPSFVPAGQTTQLIVGASGESDRQILLLTQGLYRKAALKRVYYSAYVPVMKGKNLPALRRPPLSRENRLYQADWLLRFYHFQAEEILTPEEPDFDEELDPKCTWALRHRELFPVEINRASYEMILRVPGIGVKSALRIVKLRRYGNLSFEDVRRVGIVMKRARYFMTVNGRYYGGISLDSQQLRSRLISRTAVREVREMSLFDTQS